MAVAWWLWIKMNPAQWNRVDWSFFLMKMIPTTRCQNFMAKMKFAGFSLNCHHQPIGFCITSTPAPFVSWLQKQMPKLLTKRLRPHGRLPFALVYQCLCTSCYPLVTKHGNCQLPMELLNGKINYKWDMFTRATAMRKTSFVEIRSDFSPSGETSISQVWLPRLVNKTVLPHYNSLHVNGWPQEYLTWLTQVDPTTVTIQNTKDRFSAG